MVARKKLSDMVYMLMPAKRERYEMTRTILGEINYSCKKRKWFYEFRRLVAQKKQNCGGWE
jgi:hypothetical protein